MAISDFSSYLWGLASAIGLFLLGWAAKQALDRLFLPRVLDWWAKRTQSKAEKRAHALAKKFDEEFTYSQDIRLLFYRSERQVKYRLSILAFLMVFGLLNLGSEISSEKGLNEFLNQVRVIAPPQLKDMPPEIVNDKVRLLILVIALFSLVVIMFVVIAVSLWVYFTKPGIDEAMIRHPGRVAFQTLERIERLLIAAGLSDEQRRRDWKEEHAALVVKVASNDPSDDGLR
jgi:hypothetical protein